MRCFTWKLLGLFCISLVTAAPVRAEVRIGLAAPLTGSVAWGGVEMKEGAELAAADLNAKGGVLGQQIRIMTADDYCEGEQAIAAANKLVAARVAAVVGHPCSGAALPVSKVYFEAGILMISTFATTTKLTEQGFQNVFRVVGRDDLQGRIAADFLAEQFSERRLGILHDGTVYGIGLAQETKKRLNERGIAEILFDQIAPGQVDYFDIIRRIRAEGVTVLYFAGYAPEAALIVRQAHSVGYDLQLVSGDSIGQENFGLIAGPAADGALMTFPTDPRDRPGAAALSKRISDGADLSSFLHAYCALQVWAQAVEKADTFETEAVADALRANDFDTVLGRIGFDAKGDVTGYDTFVWYVWKDGKYVPLKPGKR
jgi:branched-chain amino acid transport system substrate-binding protein